MQKIQKVTILGAGALGALYASRFHDAGGFAVEWVADGERAERLRRQGVIVNAVRYELPVTTPGQAAPAI